MFIRETNGIRFQTRDESIQVFAGLASTWFDEFFGQIWIDPPTGKLVLAIGVFKLVFVSLYR